MSKQFTSKAQTHVALKLLHSKLNLFLASYKTIYSMVFKHWKTWFHIRYSGYN